MAASPSLHARIEQAAAGGVRVKAEVTVSAAAVSTPLWAVLRCDRAKKRSKKKKQKKVKETKDRNQMISVWDQVGFYQTFHFVLVFLWRSSRLRHRSTSDLGSSPLPLYQVFSSLGQFARLVPAAEAKCEEEKPKQNQR